DNAASRSETDQEVLGAGNMALEVVSNIRNVRNTKQIPDKKALPLLIKTDYTNVYITFGGIIRKLANVESIDFTQEKHADAASFIVNAIHGEPDEIYVPLAGTIDVEAEIARLQKELEYHQGFLTSVNKKLSNERFVQNAPEQVVALEKKKQADAEAKIKALEEQLAGLEK